MPSLPRLCADPGKQHSPRFGPHKSITCDPCEEVDGLRGRPGCCCLFCYYGGVSGPCSLSITRCAALPLPGCITNRASLSSPVMASQRRLGHTGISQVTWCINNQTSLNIWLCHKPGHRSGSGEAAKDLLNASGLLAAVTCSCIALGSDSAICGYEWICNQNLIL